MQAFNFQNTALNIACGSFKAISGLYLSPLLVYKIDSMVPCSSMASLIVWAEYRFHPRLPSPWSVEKVVIFYAV